MREETPYCRNCENFLTERTGHTVLQYTGPQSRGFTTSLSYEHPCDRCYFTPTGYPSNYTVHGSN